MGTPGGNIELARYSQKSNAPLRAFSIPPPFANASITSGVWDGRDNAARTCTTILEAVYARTT